MRVKKEAIVINTIKHNTYIDFIEAIEDALGIGNLWFSSTATFDNFCHPYDDYEERLKDISAEIGVPVTGDRLVWEALDEMQTLTNKEEEALLEEIKCEK